MIKITADRHDFTAELSSEYTAQIGYLVGDCLVAWDFEDVTPDHWAAGVVEVVRLVWPVCEPAPALGSVPPQYVAFTIKGVL